ncbi:MAG: lysylphosphatidylglycerol synthase transmembrane domain-containing protein, partial [Terracidiphilus sp.]
MKKRELFLGAVVFLALAALVVWGRDRIHFDFGVFVSQLKLADWRKISFAFGCIYICYVFRAVRWALLLRHIKKVPLFSLLGTQVIGFTAVALIGRVADPVRPYLVSKKTGLPLSNQIAVYIVERLFDAGSMALIFCSVILLAPAGALPHPEIIRNVSYWALATTIAGALFLVVVRLAGGAVATLLEDAFSVVSKGLGHAVGDKIRAFRAGLDTLRSFSDFGIASSLSLGMWMLITLAYYEITTAFVASPELAGLTLAKCMLLMASGMAA